MTTPSWMPQVLDYVTVEDMYKYCKNNESGGGFRILPLLPTDSVTFAFWQEYKDNTELYDYLFKQTYKSFKYFDQEPNEDVDDVWYRFKDHVNAYLHFNSKRLSELWRIWNIEDEEYSIIDGYSFSETRSNTGERSKSETEGARSDSGQTAFGAISKTGSENNGAVTTTTTNEKGAVSKTVNDAKGRIEETGSVSVGAVATTVQNNVGASTSTQIDTVQGYNSSDWRNSDKSDTTTSARTDSSTENVGAHSDSSSKITSARTDTLTESVGTHTDTITESKGAQANTSSENVGAHTDSKTFSKGAQSNTSSEEYEDTVTITRTGNIGNESTTDILEKHERYWNRFNFYKLIFNEICKEMLLV